MKVVIKKLREYKLVQNKILKTLLTPIVFLIRLAVLFWLFYYYIRLEAIPHIIKCFNLNTVNWWHDKDELWITNCSFFNAIFCWFTWSVIILLFSIFGVYILSTGLSAFILIIKNEPEGVR